MRCSDEGNFVGVAVGHCGASVMGSGYGPHYLSDTKRFLDFYFHYSQRTRDWQIYSVDCWLYELLQRMKKFGFFYMDVSDWWFGKSSVFNMIIFRVLQKKTPSFEQTDNDCREVKSSDTYSLMNDLRQNSWIFMTTVLKIFDIVLWFLVSYETSSLIFFYRVINYIFLKGTMGDYILHFHFYPI